MNYQTKNGLDELDWQILEELQQDARLSFSEIARRINLSQPTVAERVRRLEETGVITGYHACIDTSRIGLPVTAYIRLTVPTYAVSKVDEIIRGLGSIEECHRITGDDCLIIKAHAASVQTLEEVLKQLTQYGTTSTSIVLSSVVTRRTFREKIALMEHSTDPKTII
jgi:Lrp/AsnC family transcriptional regulator, leucine-responsive regulatory protein